MGISQFIPACFVKINLFHLLNIYLIPHTVFQTFGVEKWLKLLTDIFIFYQFLFNQFLTLVLKFCMLNQGVFLYLLHQKLIIGGILLFDILKAMLQGFY